MAKWTEIEKNGNEARFVDGIPFTVGQQVSMGLGSLELGNPRQAGLHQHGQGVDQGFGAFAGIEEAKVSNYEFVWLNAARSAPGCCCEPGGRGWRNVAANGNIGQTPNVGVGLQCCKVCRVCDDDSVGAARQRPHGCPAEPSGLRKQIGRAQIVKRDHTRRGQHAWEKVNRRAHFSVRRSLVLDIDHVQAGRRSAHASQVGDVPAGRCDRPDVIRGG